MKKWMIIAIVTVLAAVLLTGCQGQLPLLQQPSGSASASSAAPSVSVEPQETSSASEKAEPAISTAVATPSAQATANIDDRSRMSVTATETVKVLPDVAYVTLGVTTQGSSADAAQNANSKIANALVAAVKAQGVKEEDIQTSNINLYQDYTDTKKYNMQADYRVKVTEIANVGKVIDAAISAGANVTYSLTFDIQDRDKVYMEALQKAMTSVADKAQKMAAAGSLTIDRVLDVSEVNQGGVYYPMADAAVKVAGSADSSVNVSPGQVEVSASVSATYLLK